jgi:hypothetical protein
MKRKATFLFAVTLATGTAAADPIQPRKLDSGAPACGNMLGKYGTAMPCTTPTPTPTPAPKVWKASVTPSELGYSIVMTVVREAQRIQEHLAAANGLEPAAS